MSFSPISIRGNPVIYGHRNWRPRHAPKYRSRPRHYARAEIIPTEMEYGMTAGTVIDEPRQPMIMPTGVYDSRGKMILRVSIPITQSLGFMSRPEPEEDDHVHALVPEDMLMITDVHGHGVAFVDTSELEDVDDDDDA